MGIAGNTNAAEQQQEEVEMCGDDMICVSSSSASQWPASQPAESLVRPNGMRHKIIRPLACGCFFLLPPRLSSSFADSRYGFLGRSREVVKEFPESHFQCERCPLKGQRMMCGGEGCDDWER